MQGKSCLNEIIYSSYRLSFVFSQAVWSILNDNHNEKLVLSSQIQRTTTGQPLTSAMMLRDITFNSISFRYPTRPDVLVLDNLTLRVPGGKVLALAVVQVQENLL